MNRLPGREISPEEILIQQQEEERRQREKENKKIRCPACKKTQYFDKYLTNPKLGVLLCPKCGVCFVDPAKLKIIKQNVTEQVKKGLAKNI